jgi:hypothetical protein
LDASISSAATDFFWTPVRKQVNISAFATCVWLVPTIFNLALAGCTLHAATGALTYSTYLGGDGTDIIHAMAVDASNNVYLTGETFSSNFPVTAEPFRRNTRACREP